MAITPGIASQDRALKITTCLVCMHGMVEVIRQYMKYECTLWLLPLMDRRSLKFRVRSATFCQTLELAGPHHLIAAT